MRASTILKGFLLFLMLSQAQAQNARYASEQRANAAVTYYSRARTMLVEALADYEQGRRYAQPNMIHDPEEFRLALISLTEELNRLVDPHVKITRDGVRVKANPRMVRRERERLPIVVDGAQQASDVGEKRRMKEIKESRARMYAPKEEEVIKEEPKQEEQAIAEKESSEAERKESVDKIIEQAVEEKSEEISNDSEQAAPIETAKEEADSEKEATSGKVVEEVTAEESAKEVEAKAEDSGKEDQAVTSAIEKTIQDRLKNLEVGLDGEAAE